MSFLPTTACFVSLLLKLILNTCTHGAFLPQLPETAKELEFQPMCRHPSPLLIFSHGEILNEWLLIF